MSKRVLVIDDSTYIRTQIRDAVLDAGLEVAGEAKNGETGLDLALELQPEVITLDNMLPDMSGLDVLQALKEAKTTSVIIMISAVGKPSAIQEAMENGATEYIVKPFTHEDLTNLLKRLK